METPAASHAARAMESVGETLDDGEQRAVLQKRQLARAEVVQQRAERLRVAPRPADADCQADSGSMMLIGQRSVHAAHAVDRDLFDEGIGLDHVLDLTLRFDELLGLRLMGCSSCRDRRHWRSSTGDAIRRVGTILMTLSAECEGGPRNAHGIGLRASRLGRAAVDDPRRDQSHTALALFMDRGFDHTTVDDIARGRASAGARSSGTSRRRTTCRGVSSTSCSTACGRTSRTRPTTCR